MSPPQSRRQRRRGRHRSRRTAVILRTAQSVRSTRSLDWPCSALGSVDISQAPRQCLVPYMPRKTEVPLSSVGISSTSHLPNVSFYRIWIFLCRRDADCTSTNRMKNTMAKLYFETNISKLGHLAFNCQTMRCCSNWMPNCHCFVDAPAATQPQAGKIRLEKHGGKISR